MEADRHWQPEEIGSAKWRNWCKDLSLKFLEWIKGDSSIPVAPTEGGKKSLAGISNGEICISLTGIWNGCPEKTKGEKDYTLIDDLKKIAISGRKTTIAFDKDSKNNTVKNVRIATKRLAELLIEAGCDVYEAEWESEKGKGIDDLIANCGADFFHLVIDNAKPIKQSDVTSQSKEEPEDKVKAKSAADRLLEIGRTATYFQTPDKVAYADVSIDGNRHTYAVRSKAFRMWFSGEYYNTEGKGIGSQTIQDILSTLEAIALFGKESGTREVHLRTAEYQGKIYLDLGTPDWKAVEIDSIGWRIVLEPPIRFWRPDSLLPLPVPVEDGNLKELKDFINVEESSWVLLITFLLFSFIPKQTYPVLVISAHRGCGKTAAAEILKGLIDPGKAPLIKLQSDTHKLAVAATRRLLMVYDNVGHISADQSDDLCRMATGFGYSTRTLHTTDEETTFEFTRPQIITAIDALVTRDDLADRVLMVQLGEISEENRLSQAKLKAKVEAAHPAILGALLTALSQTLAQLPHTKPDKLPRMADYALFAIAAEKALGLNKGEFMETFNESREQSRQIVIESSPVGEAIVRLMEKTPLVWKGTASELLNELEKHTDEATYRSRYFPKASNSLSRQLNRLAPDLKALGIDVREGIRSNNREPRSIVLEKVVKISSTSSTRSNDKLKPLHTEVLKVDDTENSNRPPIVHSPESIVHSEEGGRYVSSTPDVSSTYRPHTEPISTNALTSLVDDVDDVDDKKSLFSKENRTQFKKDDRVKYIGGDVDFDLPEGEILTVIEDCGEWVKTRTCENK